jgi:hypothetical protein
MAKMGRPTIKINQEEFEKLVGLCCTLDDIAGWFNCSPDTIENWCKKTYKETFSDTYKKKAAKGKVSLRRKQMEVALSGNVTMLIWLGKQHLGQVDKQDIEHSGKIEAVVTPTKKIEDYEALFRKGK